MKRIATSALLAAVSALAVVPADLWACPMCFDSSAENRIAFLMTAMVLTALPLGMVSGVGLWLRRRFRERDSEDG